VRAKYGQGIAEIFFIDNVSVTVVPLAAKKILGGGVTMKSIIVLVLSFFLLYGMFRYATFDRGEGYFDLESQNIQVVMCMDGDGTIRTYHINIPTEVDSKKFCKGFCNSIKQ
jgi:hypothetical protein